MVCPSPPAGSATTWADCSVGVDPTKNSGDLLWTKADSFFSCSTGALLVGPLLALGPTADIGLGVSCGIVGGSLAIGERLNGGGHTFYSSQYGLHSVWGQLLIGPHNEMVLETSASSFASAQSELDLRGVNGGPFLTWSDSQVGGFPPQAAYFGAAKLDALGNVFSVVHTAPHVATLDANITLPASGTYLVRGGTGGESFSTMHIDSFAPDQQGGLYLYGPLANTKDFGCGPVVPNGTSTYLARLDASSTCVYSRALSTGTTINVLPDLAGGVVLSASSASSLDLGCGALPAAPGGSTFVTRLSPQGACVFHSALPAQSLTIALDPGDHVVISGVVDATPVDLGGGPLAPIGLNDFVIAELDATGNYLWSKRVGGASISLSSTTLTVAQTGNLHLLTKFSGTVDFGGGPLTAAFNDTVIASFTSTGAYRSSRALPIVGQVQKGIDGCGGLVVVSIDFSFDPGCGKVLPQYPPGFPIPAVLGIARFAP